MRRTTILALTVLLGCGDDAATQAHEADAKEQSACSTSGADKFFREATEITYDYLPLSAAALLDAASTVVVGKLVSIARGYDSPAGAGPEEHTVLFELVVANSYKGSSAPSAHVFFSLSRSPLVDDKRIAMLGKSLPQEDVTLFLDAAPEAQRPAALAAGTPLFTWVGPQGVLVSNTCAFGEPLATGPLFAETPTSSSELDAALRALVD